MKISNKPTYPITIHCICGSNYSDLGKQKLICPKCGHVWELYPEVNRKIPEKVENVKKDKKDLLNGFNFGNLK